MTTDNGEIKEGDGVERTLKKTKMTNETNKQGFVAELLEQTRV